MIKWLYLVYTKKLTIIDQTSSGGSHIIHPSNLAFDSFETAAPRLRVWTLAARVPPPPRLLRACTPTSTPEACRGLKGRRINNQFTSKLTKIY